MPRHIKGVDNTPSTITHPLFESVFEPFKTEHISPPQTVDALQRRSDALVASVRATADFLELVTVDRLGSRKSALGASLAAISDFFDFMSPEKKKIREEALALEPVASELLSLSKRCIDFTKYYINHDLRQLDDSHNALLKKHDAIIHDVVRCAQDAITRSGEHTLTPRELAQRAKIAETVAGLYREFGLTDQKQQYQQYKPETATGPHRSQPVVASTSSHATATSPLVKSVISISESASNRLQQMLGRGGPQQGRQ